MTTRNVQTDFESVFNTTAWTTHGISAYPWNYSGSTSGTEFVRIGLYPDSNEPTYGNFIETGFGLISIFVEFGDGDRRAFEICDILDGLFQATTVNNTQFQFSSRRIVGVDRSNPSLWRIDYTIPYRRF